MVSTAWKRRSEVGSYKDIYHDACRRQQLCHYKRIQHDQSRLKLHPGGKYTQAAITPCRREESPSDAPPTPERSSDLVRRRRRWSLVLLLVVVPEWAEGIGNARRGIQERLRVVGKRIGNRIAASWAQLWAELVVASELAWVVIVVAQLWACLVIATKLTWVIVVVAQLRAGLVVAAESARIGLVVAQLRTGLVVASKLTRVVGWWAVVWIGVRVVAVRKAWECGFRFLGLLGCGVGVFLVLMGGLVYVGALILTGDDDVARLNNKRELWVS